MDLWLIDGAERFRRDPEVGQALLTLAKHDDSRKCLLLLESILDTPGLADRLFQVLRPELTAPARSASSSKEASDMSWESFYLLCFLVGFSLQPAFIPGGLRIPASARLACTRRTRMPASGSPRLARQFRHRGGISRLVRRHGLFARALFEYLGRAWRSGIASVSGLAGASAVFWFLVKVLLADEKRARSGGLRHDRRARAKSAVRCTRAAPGR